MNTQFEVLETSETEIVFKVTATPDLALDIISNILRGVRPKSKITSKTNRGVLINNDGIIVPFSPEILMLNVLKKAVALSMNEIINQSFPDLKCRPSKAVRRKIIQSLIKSGQVKMIGQTRAAKYKFVK